MYKEQINIIINIIRMLFDEELLAIRFEDFARQAIKGGVAVYVVGAMIGQGCRQFLLSIEPKTPSFTLN